ncbi:hypothetical protein [Rhizobium lentis]|uniref:Uncharacterized protein n=1 Tax=Rhizobium lentis TaxID=1138194 RepID=A0ABS7IBY5_9HYPH|nr:hypothetical protein [Rhizobium lentis]MBX5089398.1 hypothetical protein [Rhizobium lentis]
MADIVDRLRSNQPLAICPYDRKSPEYWTAPNDKPCKFCGGLPDGPDKCTGADTRIMGEAADEIERLEEELQHFYALAVDDPGKNPPTFWKDEAATLRDRCEKLEKALEPFADAVFNDNGDLTVNLSVDSEDLIRAYFTLRAALIQKQKEG